MKARPPRRPPTRAGAGDAVLPKSSQALVLVDFINPLDFPGASELAPAALRAAKATLGLRRRLGVQVPVIYANDHYGVWRSDFKQTLARCQALPGEAGEMARLLAPRRRDLALLKPRHSAFFSTPLDLLLGQMEVREIVLAGLATDLCVQMMAMDAFLHGYKLWVPGDCSAAETPEAGQAALRYMASALKADVRVSATR